MAKASTVLKKHLSLISEMEKAGQPNNVKNPVVKTRNAAAAKKAKVESRIKELEEQRAAFNKKMDEAITQEKKQLVDIERFEKMVAEPEQPKTEEKPKPKPKPRAPRTPKVNTDAVLKATTKRKVSPTTPKRRPTKK
ncbi:hypothetical protein G5S52_01010 [Grimontia sp. S25]|uniref:Uncharacterized protein n=1 Tax=Grimontia sedimenti TaxID=2711294 RepID=A0A6M1R1Z0_9GAMM|nr:hypothetical protein [Grimontia sedimenti]NGN96283.1 hypothetical protein [Grimontia sedimenti]